MVFLGERPQLFHVVGFALVLTGVFVASRKASAPAPSRHSAPTSIVRDGLRRLGDRRAAAGDAVDDPKRAATAADDPPQSCRARRRALPARARMPAGARAHRAGHAQRPGVLRRKAEAVVIGRDRRPAAPRGARASSALRSALPHQRRTDPAVAGIGSNRERTQQQAPRRGAGRHRPEPDRADETAAFDGRRTPGRGQARGLRAVAPRSWRSGPAPNAASSSCSRAAMSARRSRRIVIRVAGLCAPDRRMVLDQKRHHAAPRQMDEDLVEILALEVFDQFAAGLPIATTRPRLMITTKSQSCSTSSMLCDDNRMVAPRRADRRQAAANPVGAIGIERSGRLVEQQHLRIVDQRLGHRDAGFLAGREPPGHAGPGRRRDRIPRSVPRCAA